MRQSSSSIPPTSSVSFFEKYEKMFHCGGCIADDEQEPVASAILYQQSRYGNEERNLTTEAISNWSSYIRERRQQESAPLGTTVLLNQATSSYDELDKFDIEERKPKRQQAKTTKAPAKAKAHTEATAVNECFNGIRNSHQSTIQMAMQISSTTTITQRRQQQQQQHCPSIPLKYSNPSTRKSTCSSSSPKSTKRLHYDMLKEMLLANNNYRSFQGNSRYLNSNSLTQTDSDLTQSTRSMSESDDDDDEDFSLDHSSHLITPEEEEQQQQDILVSILRRTVKLDTRTDTKTTDPNRVQCVVRFEQETKFPDPNERPSSTRKHVPRMSSRQKQEYRTMMHTSYPPTTDRRRQQQRQLEVSSLLMAAAAAAGPSPLVIAPPNKHDEFRDSSLTANKEE